MTRPFRIHKSGRMGFYVGTYPLCWKRPRTYDINKCGITDVDDEVNCPRCLKLISEGPCQSCSPKDGCTAGPDCVATSNGSSDHAS